RRWPGRSPTWRRARPLPSARPVNRTRQSRFVQQPPMLHRVRLFLELVRFSHTVFALPFALLSAVLAWQSGEPFRWPDLFGVVLCMVFARSAAMAFNRLADRRLDAANPRTAGRHLVTGQLSVAAVWIFTLLCAAAFVGTTLLFWVASENLWPFYLSVPVLLFICAYSLT